MWCGIPEPVQQKIGKHIAQCVSIARLTICECDSEDLSHAKQDSFWPQREQNELSSFNFPDGVHMLPRRYRNQRYHATDYEEFLFIPAKLRNGRLMLHYSLYPSHKIIEMLVDTVCASLNGRRDLEKHQLIPRDILLGIRRLIYTFTKGYGNSLT